MNININNTVTSQSNNTTSSRNAGPQNSGTAASRDAGHTTATEKVTLSESARLIGSATSITTTYPAPDNQRISELKQEIRAGSFAIDPARIAENLHQFTISLR